MKMPPRLNIDGWDKVALAGVAREKLGELENYHLKTENYFKDKENLAYWLLLNKEQFSFEWLLSNVFLFKLELKRELNKRWERYWKILGGFGNKRQGTSDFKPEEIERARSSQIENFLGDGRRSGDKFIAKCPFHEEKHASFYVYPDNSWHCFGCGAHGYNAIDYLIKKENLVFSEAVRRLL